MIEYVGDNGRAWKRVHLMYQLGQKHLCARTHAIQELFKDRSSSQDTAKSKWRVTKLAKPRHVDRD